MDFPFYEDWMKPGPILFIYDGLDVVVRSLEEVLSSDFAITDKDEIKWIDVDGKISGLIRPTGDEAKELLARWSYFWLNG